MAVWYVTANRAQQRRIFRYYYPQLFDFVSFTFTDRLRKHVEVYAEMELNVSQTHLERFHRLADNQIGAFDTVPPYVQANRVDDCHVMRLLGLHSFELLKCVDSVFQDLIPRTTPRHSRQTSDDSGKMVLCETPEKLDLIEESASSASVNRSLPESHGEASCGQRPGPLDRIFTYPSRLLQAVGLLEPPLEVGKVRVRWKCVSLNIL